MADTLYLEVEGTIERLDAWLSQNLPDLSRSRLQKLISAGNIKINDAVCREKKQKINPGDKLTVTIPDARPLELAGEAIDLSILYEDAELIIIDKPAGLVVHPAPGHQSGTLVNALLHHCPDLEGIGGVQRPGIVHRLDKDTTGLLVVAKTDRSHQHLQAQLKSKTARRHYVAIVYGVPKTETGVIDLPVGRHPVDRKKMAVVPEEKGGRPARTHWEIKERLDNLTYMEFRLETGRTHQIRVHTSYEGHPILGDPLYSSGGSSNFNLPGQLLHAERLILEHPATGEILDISAPPPAIFTKVLNRLRGRLQNR
ncbi:MAG: Ribosomal large subunit pseudouridine synthase D [Chroococcopsis gigantea SAG 12.99]|jgi:23S rRNA pseudouridine1911/1915/1917 synthase|nr:RluA family pseudouridine synthase [Chlorogloea purpurea SAG 13.99]MDV2999132.1 Ribosomal large subunit pseudouridine synthase D [Chroococcopsis gigantea SAG 12.99]